VSHLAISPDGRWLVTGSFDKTARRWDLAAEDPSKSSVALRGHQGPVSHLAISPDGRWLVTASFDDTVRLWRLQLEDLILLAFPSAGRGLTSAEKLQYGIEKPDP
jgi:WD40 repeat protein